jgi:hypothetical protein
MNDDRKQAQREASEGGKQARPDANEGEGSRGADRRYREGVQETVRRGHVDEDAERAKRDVEASPDEYRRAEREGREHSAGEAPGDVGKK